MGSRERKNSDKVLSLEAPTLGLYERQIKREGEREANSERQTVRKRDSE